MRRIGFWWVMVWSLLITGVASAQYEAQLCWQLFSPPPVLAPFIDVIRCAVTQRPTSPAIFQAHCDDRGFFYHAGGAGTIQQYEAVDALPTVEFELTLMFTRRVDDFFIGNANCGFTARIAPPELNGPGAFQCSGGPGLPSNVDVFIKLKACPGATLDPSENPLETETPASGDLAIHVNAFGTMTLGSPVESVNAFGTMTLVSPVEPATTAVGQLP